MTLECFDKTEQEEAMRIHDIGAEIAEIDRLTIIAEQEEKAKTESLAESEAKASHEIAAEMLQKGCAYSLISEVIGLPETEIKSLEGSS